jgi:hypothetical protein
VSFCGGEQAMCFAPLPFSFSFLPPGLLTECMPNFSVGPYFLFWSVSENEAKEFACLNFLSLCCYKCYFCSQNIFVSKFGYMWILSGAILTSSDVNAGVKGQGACAMVGQGLDCKILSEILD